MGLWDRFRRRPREWFVRADYRGRPENEWTDDEHDHYMATCSDDEYWAVWERWSRQTEPHAKGIDKIRRTCLQLAREAARDTDHADDPKEFAALLRVERDTITELVLLPGTVSGDQHAIFNLWMQPVDREVRGTLHSHPDEHPYPSDDDFALFAKEGSIHIILCRPYGPRDWRAYDHTGQPVHLEVVRG
jgi:proteasome lid subunit RPN8/RPN11